MAKEIILFATVPFSFNFVHLLRRFTSLITFATLSFAYLARFEQHKAAGLADEANDNETTTEK